MFFFNQSETGKKKCPVRNGADWDCLRSFFGLESFSWVLEEKSKPSCMVSRPSNIIFPLSILGNCPYRTGFRMISSPISDFVTLASPCPVSDSSPDSKVEIECCLDRKLYNTIYFCSPKLNRKDQARREHPNCPNQHHRRPGIFCLKSQNQF